jgi:hypothetical protein
MFKKNLKILLRKIFYLFFFFIYPRIKILNNLSSINKFYKIYSVKLNKINYKIFKIINGRIYTNAVNDAAYIYKYYLLSGPSYQYRNSINSNIKNNITLKIGTPKILKNINGNVLSLLSGGASNNNYGHWLIDVLPRIYLYNQLFSKKKINFFLVPNYEFSYQKDTLKIIGIKKSKIISSKYYRHIQARNLYATSHPCNHHPENVSDWSVKFLRNTFLNKKFIKDNKFFPKKIYLDREESHLLSNSNLIKYKNYRLLLNEDEIKSYLQNIGFEIIKPQKLKFIDQVKLFSNAECVVSLYGAGLSNIIFCKPNTNVIEIKSFRAGNEFLNMSKISRLNHIQINLKPLFKSDIQQNGIMKCSVIQIQNALKKFQII